MIDILIRILLEIKWALVGMFKPRIYKLQTTKGMSYWLGDLEDLQTHLERCFAMWTIDSKIALEPVGLRERLSLPNWGWSCEMEFQKMSQSPRCKVGLIMYHK